MGFQCLLQNRTETHAHALYKANEEAVRFTSFAMHAPYVEKQSKIKPFESLENI